MNFEKFNEKMGRRPARCCGNCRFVMSPENYAPMCVINGHPINEIFTCDFFSVDESDLTEMQYMKLNNIAFEAQKEMEKENYKFLEISKLCK